MAKQFQNPTNKFFTDATEQRTEGAEPENVAAVEPVKEEIIEQTADGEELGKVEEGFFIRPTEQTSTEEPTETADGEPIKKKSGRPRKNPVKRNYHFNLNIDEDLREFLQFIAWKKRKSITEYINFKIREDKENYEKYCEEKGLTPYEGWNDEE